MGGFTIRELKETDFKKLQEWWKWWRFGDVHRFMIPDDIRSSVMIQIDGVDACCGFIYPTGASKLFHIEFIVSNPKIKDKEKRKNVIDLTVKMLIETCKSMGAVIIYTNLKNHHLINHLTNNGFQVGSNNTQEMFYLNV